MHTNTSVNQGRMSLQPYVCEGNSHYRRQKDQCCQLFSLWQDFDKTFDLFSFHLSGCAEFPLRRAALQTAKQPVFQAAPWQRGFKPHPRPAKQVTDCLLEVKHFPVKWAKSGLSVTACPKTCDPHLNSFQHDISLNQGHRSSYCALSIWAWWDSSRTEGQQMGKKTSREPSSY